MKVVKILWIDSCNSNMNWTVVEDIEVAPMFIETFGVVIKDTDEFISVAQNYGNDPEQYSNITTIPKGCVKEIFVIHEDNKRECEPLNGVKQKPAEWSEEDEEINHIIQGALQNTLSMNYIKAMDKKLIECIDWLKSLHERFNLQPKQEWSEEDTLILDSIISVVEEWEENQSEAEKEYYGESHKSDWLKSLSTQNHWKPSKEEMDALEAVVALDTGNAHLRMRPQLISLLDNLQKLTK